MTEEENKVPFYKDGSGTLDPDDDRLSTSGIAMAVGFSALVVAIFTAIFFPPATIPLIAVGVPLLFNRPITRLFSALFSFARSLYVSSTPNKPSEEQIKQINKMIPQMQRTKGLTKEKAQQSLKGNLKLISKYAGRTTKFKSFLEAPGRDYAFNETVGGILIVLMNLAIEDKGKPPKFGKGLCAELLLDYDWLLERLDSVAGDFETGEKMKALLKARCLEHKMDESELESLKPSPHINEKSRVPPALADSFQPSTTTSISSESPDQDKGLGQRPEDSDSEDEHRSPHH